mgnify:CR=1 FL=1
MHCGDGGSRHGSHCGRVHCPAHPQPSNDRFAAPFPASSQPGSQYRLKAEPAGAVHGGEKWVPKDGETTLTGAPRAPYCRDLNATA